MSGGFPRYRGYRGTDRDRHGEKPHLHENGSLYLKNSHGAYTERVRPAGTKQRADTRKGAAGKQPGESAVAQLGKALVVLWTGLIAGWMLASYKARR